MTASCAAAPAAVAAGVLVVQEAGGTSGDVLAAADPRWRAMKDILTAWTAPDRV
ncbi:hypothetical protein [Amycolatopsis sp. cmx-4-68]|uniref:hypothetical protein n=1 Tax=Amycolatopsis sp. cmx-4-68 TaxID=2790938 RepID=UPI00397A4FBE